MANDPTTPAGGGDMPQTGRTARGRSAGKVSYPEMMGDGTEEQNLNQAGDLILSLGGADVFTIDDLHRLLTAEAADHEAELVVLRRARLQTLAVRAELED